MRESPLNEQMLIELAGTGAYRRGQTYFHDGLVTLTSRSKDGFKGFAEGSSTYQLVARGIQDQMDWACSCPAAADGDFCKHLVAAALVWCQDHSESNDEDSPLNLTSRLQALDQRTLAEWLSEAAEDDPKLSRKLQLRLANDSEGVHRVLDMVLTERGYLDWRESMAFADELDAPLERLDGLLKSSPIECLELTEAAWSNCLTSMATKITPCVGPSAA